MKTLLLILALLVGTIQAAEPCPKNLGTLTLRQFDNAVQSLFNAVDRNLRRTDTYTYTDATKTVVVSRELTSSVDVTRENQNVVNYTVCKLNAIGIPTWLEASGAKLFMKSRIYIVY